MKTTIKNKTFGIMGTVGTMLMLGAVGTRAQEKAQEKTADAPATTAEAPPKPASPYELLVTAFDAGIDGWVAFGDGSKVSSTHEASKIKFGKGSLAFEYALEKGKIGGMILPVEGGKLAKMKSLRFWVRADHTLPLVVALQEKDGGRYTVTFTAPADQWQQVELAPEDFALASDKTDPKDPDGKLDLDKVENIGIMDMGVMFAQSDDATVAKLFNAPKGVHTLLLNEFVARSDAAPTTAAADKKTAAMDGLSHPQLGWFGLGGAEIRSATGKPLDGKSLKATYHQGGGQIVGMLRNFSGVALAGKTHLEFSVASVKATKLLIQLEEKDGGKYNVMVDVPADKERADIAQAFADFKPADDSKDDNATLDLNQIKSVMVLDLSGMIDNAADADNTLWISGLRATTK